MEHAYENIETAKRASDPKAPGLGEALTRLDKTTAELRELLEAFVEDLGPVLGAERPTSANALMSDPERQRAPYLERVEQVIDGLGAMTDRLRATRARLDI